MSTQLSLVDGGYIAKKDLVDLEHWQMQGKDIAEELKVAARTGKDREDNALWRLGDWMILGEDYLKGRIKGGLIRNAAHLTRLSNGRLRNIKVVCRAFPPHRRRNGLSFSIHEVIKAFPDDKQEQLLEWVAAKDKEPQPPWRKGPKRPISVGQLKKHIDDEKQDQGHAPDDKPSEGKTVKILLSQKSFHTLVDVGNHFDLTTLPGGLHIRPFNTPLQKMVGTLLVGMASIYFAQHREEMKARQAAHEAATHEAATLQLPGSRELPQLPGVELLQAEIKKAVQKTQRCPQRIVRGGQ